MFGDREKEFIINYKYHGGDLSPIYKNYLSPLAENCVHFFIPLWMAPNVITFLGLMMSFISFGATMIYNPTLEPGAPRWLHLLTGICIFLYQTLDNMDGKQARKTGSSSALGMFFDHACDAINAGITVISMGSVLGTGWSGKLFTCYGSSFFAFFFQTWEEYYTGSMLLPPFNGPTEGLLMSIGVCFIAYAVGSETFHTGLFQLPSEILPPENFFTQSAGYPSQIANVLTPYMICLLITTVVTAPTMLLHIYRVAVHLANDNKPLSEIVAAISNIFPFLLYFGCLMSYIVNSSMAFDKFAIFTVLMYCGSFAELVMYIMVCHILHTPMTCYNHLSLWMTCFLCFYHHFGSHYIQDVTAFQNGEVALLLFFSVYSLVSMVSYFKVICMEFAEVLNIHVFRLGKQHAA